MNIRAAGYIRVSTEEQAEDDKVSLDIQSEAITERCKKNGYELIEIYEDDGHSRRSVAFEC